MDLTKLVQNNNKFKVSNLSSDAKVIAIGTKFVLVTTSYNSMAKLSWDNSLISGNNLCELYHLLGQQFYELFDCVLVGEKSEPVFISNKYKEYVKTQQITTYTLNYNDEIVKLSHL